MTHATKKIGFWAVFSLVTGSQIGSGVFLLPARLSPYGLLSLCGPLIAGLGAIALSLVFAKLCSWFPKTGGPHVYIQEGFGSTAAFFTGWTYWVISWVSTTVVITASIAYLAPLLGVVSPVTLLVLQIILLLLVTALNFRGVSVAGHVEFFLTALKFIPLFIIPLIALWFFKSSNFVCSPAVADLSLVESISKVAVIAFWGFIGLESATTPASSVENPSKTIPLAVVAGTTTVALLYIFNSLSIMGVVSGVQLANSATPYADAVQYVFGGNWHLVISLIASIVCMGTLNAWMLTSGQIALGLTQDGLMPVVFGKKNKYDAPYFGLAISCLGIIPLLILMADKSLTSQISSIIDVTVASFSLVYAFCSVAFLKIVISKRKELKGIAFPLVYGIFALLFCVWGLWQTSCMELGIATLFTLSGLPLYFFADLRGLKA